MKAKKVISISPIAHPSLSDTVYKSIKEIILNHGFPRGARIRDEELAAQLEATWNEHNTSKDGATEVEAEYLEIRAIRA